VLIAKPWNSKKTRRYHRLDVVIAQKDPRPILWMKQHFGGRIQINKKGLHRVEMYQWIVRNGDAGDFLAAIRSYLVLKGDQADVALAFRATVSKVTGNKRIIGKWRKDAFQHPSPVDNLLDAKRDELAKKLSELKEVGSA
jgi:hypothetical protein